MDDRPSLVEVVMAVNDRLVAGEVGHGFGGALALAYHVEEPRTTRDLDINLSVPVEEAAEVFRLLPAGVEWSAADVDRCCRDGQIRLWHGPPRMGIPIDLFFPQHRFHAIVADGISWRPFARGDYLLPVISAAHLTVFKALFDRPQDWLDIASMLHAGTVDMAEALAWVGIILGSDHPSYQRLGALAQKASPGDIGGPGSEMEVPKLNWTALGGNGPS